MGWETAHVLSETADWTGHVIVCGLRGVGLRLIEQLHGVEVRVVAIDENPDPRNVELMRRWQVPFFQQSPRLFETLEAAGLSGARAVIVVLVDELAALEVTLSIRERRPELRVVVAMVNEAVAHALASLPGDQRVLDIASLAAPSIVSACLRDPVQELGIPGPRVVAARALAPQPGTLRDLYGDLAPVGTIERSTGVTAVCPGRDHVVAAGDDVLLVGRPEELEAADIPVHEPTKAHPITPGKLRIRKVRELGRSIRAEADSALRTALVAAVVLVIFCATVLWAFYDTHGHGHLDPLKAFYFALATIVTVGFGDYNFSGQSDPMVGFGIFMIIAGAVTFTTLVALLTNLLISRRLAGSFGRVEAARLSGHVIVIGIGAIGVRVVQGLLEADRQVVVIERDDDNRFIEQVRALGVPVIIGDATVESTLLSAGLLRASAVAALTSDDMVNIEAGLVTREALGDRWLTTPVVLRVFDRQLARTIRKAFNFRFVRSTAELSAPWFVGAALGLDVLGSLNLAREHLVLARLTVVEGGGLDGLAMGELSSRTRVIALERLEGGLEYPPRRDTRFGPGDRAYVVGPPEDVIGVLRR